MTVPKKTETIQEFLARGGKITICPTPEQIEKDKITVRSTVVGPAVILTLEEADQLYGEKKKERAKKAEKKVDINLNSLPEEFRKKLGI